LVSTQLFREGRFISTLVRVEAETGANTPVIEDAIQPDASTDGAFVAYLRVDDNLNQTLTVAGADGANPRTLVAAGEGFVSFGAPRFSPDGGAIAFGASDQAIARSDSSARYVARAASASSSSPSARSLNGGPMDIYTIPSEGGEPRKLADLDFDSPSLAWSGDGRLIFVMDASGIYAIDAEAGEYNRVADGTYHGQIDWVAPR
jgi:Tol biopolymer transport system component